MPTHPPDHPAGDALCPFHRNSGLCVANEPELHAVEVSARALLVGVNGEAEPARRVLEEASESGVARVDGGVWPSVPPLTGADAP